MVKSIIPSILLHSTWCTALVFGKKKKKKILPGTACTVLVRTCFLFFLIDSKLFQEVSFYICKEVGFTWNLPK